MKALAVWGQGVEGDVYLEIKSISVTGCDSSASESAKQIYDALKVSSAEHKAKEHGPWPFGYLLLSSSFP